MPSTWTTCRTLSAWASAMSSALMRIRGRDLRMKQDNEASRLTRSPTTLLHPSPQRPLLVRLATVRTDGGIQAAEHEGVLTEAGGLADQVERLLPTCPRCPATPSRPDRPGYRPRLPAGGDGGASPSRARHASSVIASIGAGGRVRRPAGLGLGSRERARGGGTTPPTLLPTLADARQRPGGRRSRRGRCLTSWASRFSPGFSASGVAGTALPGTRLLL